MNDDRGAVVIVFIWQAKPSSPHLLFFSLDDFKWLHSRPFLYETTMYYVSHVPVALWIRKSTRDVKNFRVLTFDFRRQGVLGVGDVIHMMNRLPIQYNTGA